MHSLVGLWRWRGNALCRRTDRAEALLALCAAVLIAVGGPLVGWLGAAAAHDSLVATARAQQQARQQVWASAVDVVARPPVDSDPESAGAPDERQQQITARWTAPDGSPRTGAVRAPHGVQPGERFRLWTDEHGRAVARPMTERTAAAHAALAGLAAGACTAGGLEVARRLAVRRLLRRRYALWDEEWSRIGPDWGRTGTSN